ncbi:hypothetical protein RHGRI_027776 [Rhododendron griersonianum]|uniref:Uncharacterized protein n=1 Tax=Rhododendron griersonianum TaxID=479676 RepID=A0AAV6J4S1_9ERIC|nr:hypothetical protein RHGRI_027776 [Rhododendron griersonianum]
MQVVDFPACIPKAASSKSAIAERSRESVSVLENGSTSEAFFLVMSPKLEKLIDEILDTRNAPSQWFAMASLKPNLHHRSYTLCGSFAVANCLQSHVSELGICACLRSHGG